MTEAYILINTEIGLENEVLGSVCVQIKEAHTVYGVYDIIARLETETMEELKNLIGMRIRRMEKIRSTLTMIVV